MPDRIRGDLEGSFRGELVEDFCHLSLVFVPAEHHESTGNVERMVGERRKKMAAHLRGEVSLIDPSRTSCLGDVRRSQPGGSVHLNGP